MNLKSDAGKNCLRISISLQVTMGDIVIFMTFRLLQVYELFSVLVIMDTFNCI